MSKQTNEDVIEYAIYVNKTTGRKEAFKVKRDIAGHPFKLINYVGGWMLYKDILWKGTEGEATLLEFREMSCEEEPLTLDERWAVNPDTLTYGYIAPDGTAYACDYQDHAYLLDHLLSEFGIRDLYSRENVAQVIYPELKNPYLISEDWLYTAGFIKIYRPSLFSTGKVNSVFACNTPDEDVTSFDDCVHLQTRITAKQKEALKHYGYWDESAYKKMSWLQDPLPWQ